MVIVVRFSTMRLVLCPAEDATSQSVEREISARGNGVETLDLACSFAQNSRLFSIQLEAAVVRNAGSEDAATICEIYNHYIQHSHATFEEVLLAPEEMRHRIEEATKTYPWLVWEEDGRVRGYSYGRRWRERAAYRHSVEATIYLEPTAIGKGTGSALFEALLRELRTREFHCVIGGVALPNPSSVALLEKLGLRKVAHFSEVGYKFGRWIDVGYWQLVL